MKKLLYNSLILTAVLTMAACQQEHVEVVYDPAKVTQQTLAPIGSVVLTEDLEDIATTYSPADFKLQVASVYALYASASSDMAEQKKLDAKFSQENGVYKVTVPVKTLNANILTMGGVADEPFTLYFRLEASLANDKNNGIASTTVYSNIVSAEFTPYSVDIKDVDKYDHVWVIGAAKNVGAWGFGNVFQYLYDYNGTGEFTGTIDFGEEGPSGGFKLTGAGNWDDESLNWGSSAQDETPEQASIQLIASGGSKDIKCFSKRFYGFKFTKSSLVLDVLYSFDNVGIVGAFNGWNAADADMKMECNPYYHRFYIDQTFADATELKFTCDDTWDLNWGGSDGSTAAGGANIAVEPGSYRIYLDINKGTYEFNASMFGKEEPTGSSEPAPGPEPVAVTGWNIIGLNGDWDNDILATQDGNVWTAYITAEADTEFKWRKDGAWDENYGGTMAALGEPFAAVAGGDNIKIAAGFYKVVLDEEALTITVSEGHVWSLIGVNGDWNKDIDMVLTDGKWVSPLTKIEGEFKLRENHGWDNNRGGAFVAVGEPFAVENNGANINVPAGSYIVTYDPEAETVVVDETGWGLVGTINGWGGTPDIILKEDGLFLVAKNVTLTADDEIKLRYKSDWGVNRGGVSVVGEAVKAVPDGSNIKPGEGSFDVYYRPDSEVIIVNPAGEALKYWGVVGTINSWAAPDYIMYTSGDGKYVSDEIEITATDEIKIRLNEAWDENRGGAFEALDTPFAVENNGSNIKPGLEGTITITYDATAETITISGEAEAGPDPGFADYIYCIGGDTGWSATYPLRSAKTGDVNNGKYKGFGYLSQEFKFKPNDGDNWAGDWESDGEGKIADNGGSNCPAPEASYYMIEVDLNELTYKLTAISTIGIIGPGQSGGWDADTDLAYDADSKSWKGTVALAADEIKFRANDGWDINWGGALDALVQGGSNIAVAEAGTYNVELFALCDGKAHATVTKQ